MKAMSIEGLTTDEDIEWLARHATGREVIVEIGAHQGRVTRALADASGGRVYAIDTWNSVTSDASARTAFGRNCGDLIDSGNVIPIQWDTQCGVPPELHGIAVDMIWIDGDHAYEAVASDIRYFAPLVRDGGLICGHDYSTWHPDVVRAVDDAYGRRIKTISIHRSIWWVT